MKFLECPSFSDLTSYMTSLSCGDQRVYGKLEAYSCKMAGNEKKLSRSLEQRFCEESPFWPDAIYGKSPVGPLTDPNSRRTLFNLICTLNASYPDYDFSELRPDQFTREAHVAAVAHNINTHLLASGAESCQVLCDKIWAALEEVIKPLDCEIYSYIPDLDQDPFSESPNLWSFNYFFYNKVLKRIVFFTCCSVRKDHRSIDPMLPGPYTDDEEEEVFYMDGDDEDMEM
eukprot:TRINITY_DN8243_c0_g1::TRINITY_DN8243_c0_g1_i1::g.10181::m.10181 TRINITY_DN8243_c0_g1::TRINITY_DN8243_c0_g1_i1::g.10181  ORF type:complete len:229 (-),score=23.40,sp/Q6PGU2/MAF1_DANRE/45.71/2e-49,Maf1/PF09174.5/5e-50 TRINITY_DN8243_c0_g1_i1:28-714(-)